MNGHASVPLGNEGKQLRNGHTISWPYGRYKWPCLSLSLYFGSSQQKCFFLAGPGEALTVQNKATVAIPSAVYTSSVDRRPGTQAATGCFNSRLRWRRPSSKVVMSYFRVLFPPARRGFAFMSRTRCCCCWPARSWQSVDGENPRWWSSPVPGGGKINCFGSLRRISKSFILFFFLMGEPNEKKVRLSFFDWWGLRRQD